MPEKRVVLIEWILHDCLYFMWAAFKCWSERRWSPKRSGMAFTISLQLDVSKIWKVKRWTYNIEYLGFDI